MQEPLSCPLHGRPVQLLCSVCPLNRGHCRHSECLLRHTHDSAYLACDLSSLGQQSQEAEARLAAVARLASQTIQLYYNRVIAQLTDYFQSTLQYHTSTLLSNLLQGSNRLKSEIQLLVGGQFNRLSFDQVCQLAEHFSGNQTRIRIRQAERLTQTFTQSLAGLQTTLSQLFSSPVFQELTPLKVNQEYRLFGGSGIIPLGQEQALADVVGLGVFALTPVFKASQHQFSSRQFHQTCDGLSRTLTLAKSQKGVVFGGYLASAWHSKCAYLADPGRSSFIFDYSLRKRFALREDRQDRAGFGFLDEGPNFVDWGVVDGCAGSEGNWGVGAGRSYGEGSRPLQFFRVLDYQVYMVDSIPD